MSETLKIVGKIFQDKFIMSARRFPAMVSGWGTGKSLCGILRAMLYSEHIPENMGVIFRKEFTDLRDSTIRDFEKYTGKKVDSGRNVKLKNGSIIMFRHLEEINNIQNINPGWIWIEQAEELETDDQFWMLQGRPRRQVDPDAAFKKLGLPERTAFITANAGSDWIRKLWKGDRVEIVQKLVVGGMAEPEAIALADGFDLIEATTYDNQDVLPPDFVSNLKMIEVQKPAIYRRFVLNDWDVSDDEFTLITLQNLEALKRIHVFTPEDDYKRLIVCDPAYGGDECVIYVFENTKIIDKKFMYERDTMKIAGEMMVLSAKHQTDEMAIDVIGMKALADRLRELKKHVIEINSSEKSSNPECDNLRAEIWRYVAKKIQDKQVCCPEDDELRRQLTKVRYQVLNSNGLVRIEPKVNVKKRIGRSPDRADAFVYGIWGLQKAKPMNLLKLKARKEALLGKQRRRELTYIGRTGGY